jgi:cation diffusion facilitator family transporter
MLISMQRLIVAGENDNRLIVKRSSLTRFAWLSIAAAIITISLKAVAYFITGSVGLLSDALESLVNLAGAVMALAMLVIAARPPDEEHAYGHSKAEYFSSGVEGALITLAAVTIAITAINRLLYPQPLEQPGLGLTVSLVASGINLLVAQVLLRAGKRYNSITLEADGKHLMTDVWTSIGVVAGLVLVVVTGLEWLDPVIALLVAANIVYTGVKLVKRSAYGLLDTALPNDTMTQVRAVLDGLVSEGVKYHALRSREAAARSFVSVHILVPGNWSVQRGHELLERVEASIREVVPGVSVFTHLEPEGDKASYEDQALEREPAL